MAGRQTIPTGVSLTVQERDTAMRLAKAANMSFTEFVRRALATQTPLHPTLERRLSELATHFKLTREEVVERLLAGALARMDVALRNKFSGFEMGTVLPDESNAWLELLIDGDAATVYKGVRQWSLHNVAHVTGQLEADAPKVLQDFAAWKEEQGKSNG